MALTRHCNSMPVNLGTGLGLPGLELYLNSAKVMHMIYDHERYGLAFALQIASGGTDFVFVDIQLFPLSYSLCWPLYLNSN